MEALNLYEVTFYTDMHIGGKKKVAEYIVAKNERQVRSNYGSLKTVNVELVQEAIRVIK